MSPASTLRCGLVALLMSALGGCALTNKGDALTVRWYSPERTEPRLTSAETRGAPRASAVSIELGRVSAATHLREKILYRDARYEVGYYDDRRWTERPEAYVRREVARTLFEKRGFRRVMAGSAPVLDVEVVSFEEIRHPRAPAARVELRVLLHTARDVLLEETITVDKPSAEGFEGFVAGMADALDEASAIVAQKVEAAAAPR